MSFQGKTFFFKPDRLDKKLICLTEYEMANLSKYQKFSLHALLWKYDVSFDSSCVNLQ